MRIKDLILIAAMVLAGCTAPADEPTTASGKPKEDDVDLIARSAVKVVKTNASEATSHLYNLEQAAKEQIYGSMDHIANWMRPDKPKPNLPVAASYCYHVYQDIVCYRSPMPGWENRLAGYQGTGAAPPELAMMQPLPAHQPDLSQLPENRAKDAKPVFVSAPKKTQDEKADDPNSPITTEAPHDQLVNPATAPQL